MFINGEWVEIEDIYKIYNKYIGDIFLEVFIVSSEFVDKVIEVVVYVYKYIEFLFDNCYIVLLCVVELLK